MKRCLHLLLFIVLLAPYAVYCQTLALNKGCNFADGKKPALITISDPGADARRIIDEIIKVNPEKFSPTFILNSGNVPNAIATEVDGQRYIIYNEAFMNNFNTVSLTSHAARFLLAHEVGHHALRHNFGTKTKEQSFADELAADAFAAKVMARLEATLNETLAGINTFDKDQESATHPDPSVRQEIIAEAWRNEIKTNPKPATPLKKFPLELNASAFANPWNLIHTAKAEIDDEKVTITFNIPLAYQSKRFRVCLKSTDSHIVPESRTPRTVNGTGYDLPYAATNTIVWNYKLDKFVQSEAGRSRILSLYVYAMDDQPTYPSKTLPWCMIVSGAGTTLLGFTERSKGLEIYNNDYKVSYSEKDFEKADKHYFRSHFIIGGGIALAGIGIWVLTKKAKRTKEVTRSTCFSEPRWHFDPWVSTSGVWGMQANYRF